MLKSNVEQVRVAERRKSDITRGIYSFYLDIPALFVLLAFNPHITEVVSEKIGSSSSYVKKQGDFFSIFIGGAIPFEKFHPCIDI